MPQLSILMIPGLSDLPDSAGSAHRYALEDSILKICENGKFSAVRHEVIFCGYYKGGDTVGSPVSPVDGYQYSPEERRFTWTLFTTRAAGPNFVSGQGTVPAFADGTISLHQPANLYWLTNNVEDFTGEVQATVSYFAQGRVPETFSGDGIFRVDAICQRQSLNTSTIEY
jgi:hypothetical protein